MNEIPKPVVVALRASELQEEVLQLRRRVKKLRALLRLALALGSFFGLTFLVSWTCFFGAALVAPSGTSPTGGVAGGIYLAGVFAPAFVAVLLTMGADGREDAIAFLRRAPQIPARTSSYLFAIGYMAVAKLGARSISPQDR